MFSVVWSERDDHGDSGTDWLFDNGVGDLGSILDAIRDRSDNDGLKTRINYVPQQTYFGR
jgi:hypothetical protein